MRNWNVIISIFQDGFRHAIRELRKLGPVERSPYHNVLLMAVEDPIALLEAIERRTEVDPALYDAISRVAPATQWFEFHSAEDFQAGAKQIVMEWAPRLAGQSFHVRLHRRGLKHNLRSPDVERDLGEALLQAVKQAGAPASLSFSILLRSRCGDCNRHNRRARRDRLLDAQGSHAPSPTPPGLKRDASTRRKVRPAHDKALPARSQFRQSRIGRSSTHWSEGAHAGRECERQQQLVGQMQLDSGA